MTEWWLGYATGAVSVLAVVMLRPYIRKLADAIVPK